MQLSTKARKATATGRLHRRAQFWSVADHFRKLDTPWITYAGYELRKDISVGGKPWRVCLKIHVLGEVDDKLLKASGIRFESTVTFWPPASATKRDEKFLVEHGWYANTKKALAEHGYVGAWENGGNWKGGPSTKWGNFTKTLTNLPKLRQESRWLENLEFDSAGTSLTNRTSKRESSRKGTRK